MMNARARTGHRRRRIALGVLGAFVAAIATAATSDGGVGRQDEAPPKPVFAGGGAAEHAPPLEEATPLLANGETGGPELLAEGAGPGEGVIAPLTPRPAGDASDPQAFAEASGFALVVDPGGALQGEAPVATAPTALAAAEAPAGPTGVANEGFGGMGLGGGNAGGGGGSLGSGAAGGGVAGAGGAGNGGSGNEPGTVEPGGFDRPGGPAIPVAMVPSPGSGLIPLQVVGGSEPSVPLGGGGSGPAVGGGLPGPKVVATLDDPGPLPPETVPPGFVPAALPAATMIPEPAGWLVLIVGFVCIGTEIRRRRALSA